MKPSKVIDVANLYGDGTLAGAGNGQSFLGKLIDCIKGESAGSVIALDFAKVELVSASFFRAAFRPFRDFARSSAKLYLFFANANAATLEEVHFFAESTGDAYPFGKLNSAKVIRSSFVV